MWTQSKDGQICGADFQKSPHVSCDFKGSWLCPSFTTGFWQVEKLFRAQSDEGTSIFQPKALWHLILRDWYYRQDPKTPIEGKLSQKYR